MSIIEDLRQRRLVQWGLAYLAHGGLVVKLAGIAFGDRVPVERDDADV